MFLFNRQRVGQKVLVLNCVVSGLFCVGPTPPLRSLNWLNCVVPVYYVTVCNVFSFSFSFFSFCWLFWFLIMWSGTNWKTEYVSTRLWIWGEWQKMGLDDEIKTGVAALCLTWIIKRRPWSCPPWPWKRRGVAFRYSLRKPLSVILAPKWLNRKMRLEPPAADSSVIDYKTEVCFGVNKSWCGDFIDISSFPVFRIPKY